jgi:hypothetical protein
MRALLFLTQLTIMQLFQKNLLTVLLIIFAVATYFIFFSSNTDDIPPDVNSQKDFAVRQSNLDTSLPDFEADAPDQQHDVIQSQQQIPEGVNTIFRDEPKAQVAWMERGKSVVIKNKPDADAANFRNTFFHRGAKARPVTCGEVEFSSDGTIIDDYQRFIYTGVQSTYLEHDVVNFDIFWSMMCEQTLDEYFETQD